LLVNNFVINTCSFLDSFAEKCDTGLSRLRDRITELEILTVVLEAKLSIIPEVQGEQQSNTQSEPPVNRPPPPPPTSTPLVDGTPPPAPPSAPMPATTTPVVVDQSALVVVPISSTENHDSSTIAVSKHSTYKKYFKMVSMNIPVEAAKMKMRTNGLDPDLLDTPDLLIPIDGHEQEE